MVRENVIVLYLAHEHSVCNKQAKYRTITFSFTRYTGTPEDCSPFYVSKSDHGGDHVTWTRLVAMKIM